MPGNFHRHAFVYHLGATISPANLGQMIEKLEKDCILGEGSIFLWESFSSDNSCPDCYFKLCSNSLSFHASSGEVEKSRPGWCQRLLPNWTFSCSHSTYSLLKRAGSLVAIATKTPDNLVLFWAIHWLSMHPPIFLWQGLYEILVTPRTALFCQESLVELFLVTWEQNFLKWLTMVELTSWVSSLQTSKGLTVGGTVWFHEFFL